MSLDDARSLETVCAEIRIDIASLNETRQRLIRLRNELISLAIAFHEDLDATFKLRHLTYEEARGLCDAYQRDLDRILTLCATSAATPPARRPLQRTDKQLGDEMSLDDARSLETVCAEIRIDIASLNETRQRLIRLRNELISLDAAFHKDLDTAIKQRHLHFAEARGLCDAYRYDLDRILTLCATRPHP